MPDPPKTETALALAKASSGLLMPSETDAPFEPIAWGPTSGALDEAAVRKLAGAPSGAPVETTTLDDLFRDAAQPKTWQDAQEKAQAKRFQDLAHLLKSSLTDLRVYRVGETNIEVFIVGKDARGHWSGLKTQVVET